MIKFIEIIKTSLHSLTGNKLRSFLTVLGIVIGVMSVVALISLGQGAQKSIESSVSSIGSSLITIIPGRITTGSSISFDTSTKFTIKDYEAIRDNKVRYIEKVTAGNSKTYLVEYQNLQATVGVTGIIGEYFAVRGTEIQKGREINQNDYLSVSRVAIIGPDLSKSLFKDENPVGKTIKINKINFIVVGVTKPKGSTGFSNPDIIVIIPLSTHQQLLSGQDNLSSIAIKANSPNNVALAEKEAGVILRKSRNLKPDQSDDFTIGNSGQILSTLNQITGIFTVLVAAIASISLLVGGIGIMNIMLVTVTERTKEIGLRKSLGATNNDILTQFLIESVIVTLLGGFIGLVLGLLLSAVLSEVAQIQSTISLESIVLALGVSIIIGLVFGIYPARRAASLNLIEALRYE